jgi:alpha-L-fucosidase
MKKIVLFALALLMLHSCQEVQPPKPFGPLPSERQLAWHELEYYAFVHFNMNTFTDIEWGMGSEKPQQFNPSELDCRQWASVCKEAGMRGIILTAKHHDGFCLWPTKTTAHSVTHSPWKDGEGDVVKELSEACQEYGLKFGVYLSPWDRNNEHYGTPEYITIFRDQLRELLTNYGEVFEVWFDGANGGTGYYGGANENRHVDRKNYYDWPNTIKIIRELQPQACIFGDGGPDVRWVGNEEGWANATNWCLIRRDEVYPGWPRYKELRSGHEDGTHWVPAEADVSIRPGWYYHSSEDHKVKSLPHLLDIYYQSVGRNASLLLNFPVDTRGLIHEKDVEAVMALANTLKQDFQNNLAREVKISSSIDRGRGSRAANMIDGDPQTYWCTPDSVTSGSIQIDFKEPTVVNRFLVQEYIPLGQRVQEFTLEAFVDNAWMTIAEETTIGYKRILRFEPVQTRKLRFTIMKAKACPLISNIELYRAPAVKVAPEIRRNKAGVVFIESVVPGAELYYTLDGSDPGVSGQLFEEPFLLNGKVTVRAISKDKLTKEESPVAQVDFDVAKDKWSIVGVDDKKAEQAIDDRSDNVYHFMGEDFPVDVIVDLGEELNIKGFSYLPDQGRWSNGIIKEYAFYVSMDGKDWGEAVSEGEFSNIKNSPIWQNKQFDVVKGRFIKLQALSEVDDRTVAGIAELNIVTE